MKQIVYRKLKNYKYQLWKDYKVQTPIKGYRAITPFLNLFKNGNLLIKQGYSYDGPSGPTIDTHTFMRGALVHDAFYQLMRMKLIDQKERIVADKLLQQHCIEDGMNRIRAWWVYHGVRSVFGKLAAKPNGKQKIYVAPKGNLAKPVRYTIRNSGGLQKTLKKSGRSRKLSKKQFENFLKG